MNKIYDFILSKGQLFDKHRMELIQKRGFSDETIAKGKFFSSGKYLASFEQEMLSAFTEDDLLKSGAFYVPRGSKKIQISSILLDERIVIPYLDESGSAFCLRPHKLGLHDVRVEIYVPSWDMARDIIMAESEFKAAAAVQLGISAIGIPGIASFSKEHFQRLVDFLAKHKVRDICIIFDSEEKADPKYKNYKDNPADRHDTEFYAYYMSYALDKQGFRAQVGTLPDSWRVNGKIDIDGALAQGKGKEDLAYVIQASKPYKEYLEDLSAEAKTVCRRKMSLRYFKTNIHKDFGKYVATRRRGKTEWEEVISNFTMKIIATHKTAEGLIREIQFTNEFGEYSSCYAINPEDMGGAEGFTKFCFTHGNFIWHGFKEDLLNIWEGLFLEDDGRQIVEPDHVGWIEDEHLWLFSNVIIDRNGAEMRPDKNGIFWVEKKGVKPIPLAKNAMQEGIPALHLSGLAPDEIKEKLSDTIGKMQAKICLGWISSVFFMEEVFAHYECFPILFLFGRRRSGKSTVGKWLMRMVGVEVSDKMASDTTPVAMQRYMAYYSSLPLFIDEYRNTKNVTFKDGFLRSAYSRQSAGKGIRQDFGVREGKVRGTLLIAGEETPQDSALLDRCVVATITPKDRIKDQYDWFVNNKSKLSGFGYYLLTRKPKLIDKFIAITREGKDYFISKGMDERIAIHYAIVSAGYGVLYGEEDIEFASWITNEAQQANMQSDEEHSVVVFFSDLQAMAMRPDTGIGDKYWVIDDGKVFLYFDGLYNAWAEDYRRRKGEPPFKASAIRHYLKEEPGFIGFGEQKSLGKFMRRCVEFDLSLASKDLQNLVEVQIAKT